MVNYTNKLSVLSISFYVSPKSSADLRIGRFFRAESQLSKSKYMAN